MHAFFVIATLDDDTIPAALKSRDPGTQLLGLSFAPSIQKLSSSSLLDDDSVPVAFRFLEATLDDKASG